MKIYQFFFSESKNINFQKKKDEYLRIIRIHQSISKTEEMNDQF